ncbi:MAG TPA: diguanylate cyclase [Desulfobacteraceae bacterium]|nr:diguanylate cyclase [Desulfobacteraceae bacterium]
MNFITNLPLRFKLFIAYAIVFAAVISISFSILFYTIQSDLEQRIKNELNVSNQVITDMVETAATVSIKNHLRAIAEKNLEIIRWIYQTAQINGIGESEARKQAVEVLASQTIGKTGYIYCIDSNGIAVVHPVAGVRGKDFSYREFIQSQISKKQGYLEYDWKNPNETSRRPKALYMVYFEPWDWIISVSSYKSEFSSLISIDDFREQIETLTFGETGYSYIVDTKGNSIIHPELSGNVLDITDSHGRHIVREMIERRSGYITYNWRNPSESVAREKFVAFDHMPTLDWIIASSSYTAEVFGPLAELKQMFMLVLVVSLTLTGAVTLMISASITKPLSTLIQRFEQGARGDWSLKIMNTRHDEIGQLWSNFNRFMDQLTTSRNDLIAEIKVRETAENQLKLFEKVFENTSEGICITDDQGTIKAVNNAFTRITGYGADEVLGENPRILRSDRHDPKFYEQMWASLIKDGYWSGEIWNRKKSGEAYPELLSISSIRETGTTDKYIAVFHDISEMKLKEHQIEHLAYHDPLTNLPNRSLLKDRLVQAISDARRSGEMIQILFLDLDNFKNVNDTVGHAKGDELLKETARRLEGIVRDGDTVSRLGGDEFIIMIPHMHQTGEMLAMVERIQSVFDTPFELGGQRFHVTGSIGMAVYPLDGTNEDSLIKNADLAMYQTKNTGKNHYSVFEPQMASKISERVRMEADLREGIKANEFQVYFQPRIDAATGQPKGMEALARWIKKDGSLVPPNEFIPLAEESGLIIPFGEQIFDKSVTQALDIRSRTGIDLKLSVNVSPRQFEDPNFESMIKEILDRTGFPGDRLEIEITESILVKDINRATKRLKSLARLGITTAIDDFGTGYSSLAYIKRLPISVLKIDKTFVDNLPHDKEDMVIVETTILMANKLNLLLVAEGVETREQLDVLSRMGSMEIQGYLFSPPLPKDKFETWLSRNPSGG